MARWSSGQDAALSRLKQGFDSLTGHFSLIYGSLAQLGERLPYKQDVTGSSPVIPINKNDVHFEHRFFILYSFCIS